MAPAIRVEQLSKSYRIGRSGAPGSYRTLRESLMDGAAGALRRFRGDRMSPTEEFWALREIDFEVQPGEVVGIIGRNGAGKSTLLKILSRITEPTSGRVRLRGRVGSLLEVGTGFHPELTGRENVYLNGAILGMSRREVTRKFDEIVAFAEVEQFLDTPVKRYSSGMYVRLAFAVAAHLEPEILIVDEVLAVGDASFQKKCLGKMQHVASAGRTVFFVSHQLESVRRLCTTAIWMERGRIKVSGSKNSVIQSYLATGPASAQVNTPISLATAERQGKGWARFAALQITSGSRATADQLYPDGPLIITLSIDSSADRVVNSLAVFIVDLFGTKLVNTDTLEVGTAVSLRAGRTEVQLQLEQLHLKPGTYRLGLWLADAGDVLDRVDEATTIEIVDLPSEELGGRPRADGVVTSQFRFIALSGPVFSEVGV